MLVLAAKDPVAVVVDTSTGGATAGAVPQVALNW